MSIVKFSGIKLDIPKVTMEKKKKHRLDKLYYIGDKKKCKVETTGLEWSNQERKKRVDDFYKKLWAHDILKPVGVEYNMDDVRSLGAQTVRIYKQGNKLINSISGREILLNDIDKVILENVTGRAYNDRKNITIRGVQYKVDREIIEDIYKPIEYAYKWIETNDDGRLELHEKKKKAYIIHLPVESKIEKKIFLPGIHRVYNDGNTEFMNDPWVLNKAKASNSRYIYDKDMPEKDPKFFNEITSIDVSDYRLMHVTRGTNVSTINIPVDIFETEFQWVTVSIFLFVIKYKYKDVNKVFEINNDNFKDNYVFNSIIWGRIKNWLSHSWGLELDGQLTYKSMIHFNNPNLLIEYKAYLLGIRPNHEDYKKTIDLKKSYDYVVKSVRDMMIKYQKGTLKLETNANYNDYKMTKEFVDKVMDERTLDPLEVILNKVLENKKDINKE